MFLRPRRIFNTLSLSDLPSENKNWVSVYQEVYFIYNVYSTLLKLFLIYSKKLCTHMKLVTMFIENKQKSAFQQSHTWTLFLFPELCLAPSISKHLRLTFWIIICWLPLALILHHQRRNHLKFFNESIHFSASLSSYSSGQFFWLKTLTVMAESKPLLRTTAIF